MPSNISKRTKIAILGIFSLVILVSSFSVSIIYVYKTENITKNNSFDRNDPYSIRNIGVPVIIHDIEVKDSIAYIANDWELLWYNLTDPEGYDNFHHLDDTWLHTTPCSDMVFQNDSLYTIGGYYDYGFYLSFYNFSGPYDTLGNLSSKFFNGNTDQYFECGKLQVNENIIYSIGNWYQYRENNYTLRSTISIFNITNPLNITEFNNRYSEDGYFSGLALVGERLFITKQKRILMDFQNQKYEIGEQEILIFNTVNKSNIQLEKRISCNYNPTSILMHSSIAFITYENKGLEIIDFTDIENPLNLGSHFGDYQPVKIILDENIAYLLNLNGLSTLDISDYSNIKHLDTKVAEFYGNGEFISCAKYQNYILGGRWANYYGKNYFVFDCSNLNHLKIIYPDFLEIEFRSWILRIILGYVLSPLTIILIIVTSILKLRKKKQITV